MEVLLDTTIIIDFLRQNKKTADYLGSLSVPTVSLITQAEIYQGVKDKNELGQIEKLFKKFTILPVTAEISLMAVKLLKEYRLSHGLHILDAFIASTAIIHKLTLVTANIKDFHYIKELKLASLPNK